jgi:hypothetical protein
MGLVGTVGACSSSGGGIKPIGADNSVGRSTRSIANSSTSAAATTTTIDPTRSEILSAYRRDENIYLSIANHYPIVPLDPRLPQAMTGAELKTVGSRLAVAAMDGQYGSGTVDLAPVVTAVNGTAATISDCLFDHAIIVDGRTGQPITAPATQTSLEKVTMTLENGTWKISDEHMEGSGCVPAARP